MINFFFPNEKNAFEGLARISELAREKSYPNTMLGPFEDYCLLKLGITIDGDKEVELAEKFEEWITEKKYIYEKKEELGVEFYKERQW